MATAIEELKVFSRGQPVTVRGRAARIVATAIVHQREINTPGICTVTFACKRETLGLQITESLPPADLDTF